MEQLEDDTWFDFSAAVVLATDLDTDVELAAYDVVILGDSGYTTADWADFDQVAGRRVRLTLPNATLTGIARGVDATGALVLETADGRLQPCIGGEVSLRLES